MKYHRCTCIGVGIRATTLIATMSLLLLIGACNSSDELTPLAQDPTLSGVAQAAHPHVPLKDALGNHLVAGSTEPYSPKQTCGGCHDYDLISNAYHFQQGRTDSNGNVHMKDDFFGDGRDFLKSDGMYGKW